MDLRKVVRPDWIDACTRLTPLPLAARSFTRAYNSEVRKHAVHFFGCVYSYLRGYRYNFPFMWPTLYLAPDMLTAAAEIDRNAAAALGALRTRHALYQYVDVAVTANVLDLTDAAVRRAFGVDRDDLLVPTDDWRAEMDRDEVPLAAELGAAAALDRRFDGILYPSYAAHAFLELEKANLALFMHTDPPCAKPRRAGAKLELDPDDVEQLKNIGCIV